MATTIYFLPGDAYFRTTITEEFLEKQQKGKPIAFGYRPADEYFCGVTGTGQLRIADEEGKLLEQLKQAYAVIRKHFPKQGILHQDYKTIELEDGGFRLEKGGEPEFRETNELHVFVYNADFDFEKHRLLHLYNENWEKETLGQPGGPQEVVDTREVLLESIRNGAEVPPLKVSRKGSFREAAHLVPNGELQIIIVPLKDWLGPVASMKTTRRKLLDIYIIKSDGLYKRSLKDGKWTPELKMTYEEVTRPGPTFF